MTPICYRGPDIVVVGWIPYFDRLSDLPTGNKYPASVAMHLLFNSGNDEPPEKFSGGYDEFLTWLHARKDYRAAFYLRDVTLRYEVNKQAPMIHFVHQPMMGFTPLRLTVAGNRLSPPGRLGRHKGVSPNDYPEPKIETLSENKGVKISYSYQFKLSPIIDNLQRILTGRWAPNAWGMIEYEIRRSGAVRIVTAGTSIPSQDVYIDWQRVNDKRFDMLKNSSQDIAGFLTETAGCKDAPKVNNQFISEPASRCDKI